MRRGSTIDPPNRFEAQRSERDDEQLEWDQEYLAQRERRAVEFLDDHSKSIVSENDSPDVPFQYSINPYRGCTHGCSYCYARNSHEYLGFNAGLDFETKIVVKREAASLFRDFLAKPTWNAEPITFSGVTDCYQPAERTFRLTRQLLEIAWEHRQPIGIVTKNALVVRDLDILRAMAALRLAHVFLSVNSLDADLAREMEPQTSVPAARMRAITRLADAGVPVGVLVAPVIPGLNDSEIPAVLEAAKNAGAQAAGYNLLRLPLSVETVFLDWLERTQLPRVSKVLSRIRATRGGELYRSEFGERMRGSGPIADQINQLFSLFAKNANLPRRLPDLSREHFRPPLPTSGQLRLF